MVDSDLEIGDVLKMGHFRNERPEAYVLSKLNPLVNRLLGCLKAPFELKIRDRCYEVVQDHHSSLKLRSREEMEVIRLIRTGEYQTVTVRLKEGEIKSVDAEAERTTSSREGLLELLDSDRFQTITVTKHDGEVVRVTQKRPIKFESGATRQREPERGSRRR